MGVAAHDGPELRSAGGVLREDGVDLPRRGLVANAGLVAGPRELVLGEHGGEVDEGLWHARHRDALDLDDLPWSSRPAGLDPLDAAFGRRPHLGLRRRALEEAEEVSAGAISEERSLAAGLDGSHKGG